MLSPFAAVNEVVKLVAPVLLPGYDELVLLVVQLPWSLLALQLLFQMEGRTT
jgi:hypothetical protein